MDDWRSLIGVPQCMDAVEFLRLLPDASIDAVITDPPYPCIKRSYGYWTVEEWWSLIVDGVVPQVRRVLKPTGSAVFILQPNSEHVGQMRGWLWEFMAWVCREWNMVQDAYWWNYTAIPMGGVPRAGLLRQSTKACVWVGAPDCYRNQRIVRWCESDRMRILAQTERAGRKSGKGGMGPINRKAASTAFERNGGVTPHNIIPIPAADSHSGAGAYGHSAGTPLKLADWWTRYIVPPGGVVCDPFMGSGTMALAAIQNGCQFVGCDRVPEYVEIARRRVAEALAKPQQAALEMAL